MENFKKLLRLAKRFELKYIVAQKVSAQAGDVEATLKSAGLWELSNQVSSLLDQARVPSDASVDIKINIKPGNEVSFTVLTNPANPKASQTLALLLSKSFSRKMSEVLAKSGLGVGESVVLNWLTF